MNITGHYFRKTANNLQNWNQLLTESYLLLVLMSKEASENNFGILFNLYVLYVRSDQSLDFKSLTVTENVISCVTPWTHDWPGSGAQRLTYSHNRNYGPFGQYSLYCYMNLRKLSRFPPSLQLLFATMLYTLISVNLIQKYRFAICSQLIFYVSYKLFFLALCKLYHTPIDIKIIPSGKTTLLQRCYVSCRRNC